MRIAALKLLEARRGMFRVQWTRGPVRLRIRHTCDLRGHEPRHRATTYNSMRDITIMQPRTTLILGLAIIGFTLGVAYLWGSNDGAFTPRSQPIAGNSVQDYRSQPVALDVLDPYHAPHSSAQSWDQENLKRHDAGCPTAIFYAPGGNLRLCSP